MPEQITQNGRALKAYSPLEFDVLLVESISVLEAMSRPFRFTVKLLADVLNGYAAKGDRRSS